MFAFINVCFNMIKLSLIVGFCIKKSQIADIVGLINYNLGLTVFKKAFLGMKVCHKHPKSVLRATSYRSKAKYFWDLSIISSEYFHIIGEKDKLS